VTLRPAPGLRRGTRRTGPQRWPRLNRIISAEPAKAVTSGPWERGQVSPRLSVTLLTFSDHT